MAQIFYLPQAVRIQSTGVPYAAAEANFYLTTTTTRTDTYTTNALSVAHANPVIADSAGQWPTIYLKGSITYRCIITQTGAGATIDDEDPIHSPLIAVDIGVTDAGGYFAGTELEAVTQDVGANYAKKSAANTFTADITLSSADIKAADNVIERPEIKDFSLTHTAITSSSNAITADAATGNSFYHLLTENTTFTLSNPSPTGKYCQITIEIQQDGGGGAYTVSWPASVLWAGGSGPTISTGNDAIDLVTLSTRNAGTSWYGSFAQAFA